MVEFCTESPNSQMQQPHIQNQQVPLTHTQGAVNLNIMHSKPTANQNRQIPNKWYNMNKDIISVQMFSLN